MSDAKRITYSLEFKEEAVRLYLEGHDGYRQICVKLGIKDKKTLQEWVARVKNGESLEDGRGKSKNHRKGRPRSRFASAEEELAFVKAERDYLKKLYRSRFGHEWGAHKKSNSLP